MKKFTKSNQFFALTGAAFVAAAGMTDLHAHGGEDHKHDKSEAKEVTGGITGTEGYMFKADPTWGGMEEGKRFGQTHGGVVIDKQGLVYVSTDTHASIHVFGQDGKLLKSIAPEARGVHHMAIREENGEEFIYCAQLLSAKNEPPRLLKMKLDGEIVMTIPNENTGEVEGGFKGTTGIAVAPDGTIYCSMGYGSNLIHAFSPEGKHLNAFGGQGRTDGKFVTPHTLSIDLRFDEPRILVCDRENRRLQHFTLGGEFIGIHSSGLNRPCSVSFLGDLVAVAELEARVTLLDKEGKILAHLGENDNKEEWAKFNLKPEGYRLGVFSAPHGVSFDKDGNLYVQDWNVAGRVTKLEKLDK
ncbi:hypothetical protein [Rubritalea marina]|uniref:hypothetical protein n=1 Tax=Rubritalea marina TaxID=361055 RepID=UPI0003667E48|nr:hypothetical protein [Rubritalea marina]